MEINFIQGQVYDLLDLDIKSDKFRKRELVIEVVNSTDKGTFTEYIKLQCINEKTDLLEDLLPKDIVSIKYRVSGRKFESETKGTMYFTNLDIIDLDVVLKHNEGPQKITPDDTNDYSEILPGLANGSVDLSNIGSEKKKPENDIKDDLPF